MSQLKKMSEVRKIEDLINYLHQKGQNHNWYYHYTTWDSFEKIYQNKSFLLTRGNSLNINDQHEALMKGSYYVWNRTYIGSFSHGSSENMAMWGLYGQPSQDAIRITIPKTAMLKWVNSIDKVFIWNEEPLDQMKAEVALTDIVYASGESHSANLNLYRSNEVISTKNIAGLQAVDSDKRMTGYIKNIAWRYENEVRIRIELPDCYPSDKIMINVPESVLDSMIIAKWPLFEPKNSQLYLQLRESGKIEESAFTHLLKFRPLCNYCVHNFEKISE